MSKNILITRDRIAEVAVKMLKDAGYTCIFSPPYDSPDVVAQKAKENNICAIMVSQGKITREVIAASSDLNVIVKHGSGVNNINIKAAEDLGVPVYRALGANALAVAEHAITLMLTLQKSILSLDANTKQNNWLKGSFVGRDIAGATLGLIGIGEIGQKVANLAHALGMNVKAYDPGYKKEKNSAIELVDHIDLLLPQVDIVSLHCPLTESTKNLINKQALAKMKPTAFLINTARGGIIDEQALVNSLKNKDIAGAALDSFANEPLEPSSTLLQNDMHNLILTPHIAGVTIGAEDAMATIAANIIIEQCEGKKTSEKYHVNSKVHGGLSE